MSFTIFFRMKITASTGPAADSLATWMFVSQLQYWLVLFVVMMTLPLLVAGLFRLRRLRRSPYYHFLVGICAANVVSLSTILFDLLSPSKHNMQGDPVPNQHRGLIVVMFAQRFAVLLFPLQQMTKRGCIGFFFDARKLLSAVILFSVATQSWALIFMTDRLFEEESGKVMVICETDPTKIDPTTATWMSVMEMTSTYLLPFLCTLIVDLGVLVWSRQRCNMIINETAFVRGTLVTSMGISIESKTLSKSSSIDHESGVKIQSQKSVDACNRKRGTAIKRCLMMATVQVLINLPYHTLQVFDEIYDFANDRDWFAVYFYADALMYLIYLLQYPAVLLHIEFLISDLANKNDKSPLMPGSERPFLKQGLQSAESDNISWKL
ncbi:hypothetical protein PRIPAC_80819 [Pristionchus pacificus]|uniref:Uncharacterized protein n=1 Tax=Pristionchus pacificus TaxID=54126 RepID=A0A2A6CK30_PRIPA|nr:hypothetical protein PRIPAC_80819 [Pristionchus pacificus]|eukprot:PDM78585.1 hypothetical protein PRIPAC_31164 [Pristionchus pacificus]